MGEWRQQLTHGHVTRWSRLQLRAVLLGLGVKAGVRQRLLETRALDGLRGRLNVRAGELHDHKRGSGKADNCTTNLSSRHDLF